MLESEGRLPWNLVAWSSFHQRDTKGAGALTKLTAPRPLAPAIGKMPATATAKVEDPSAVVAAQRLQRSPAWAHTHSVQILVWTPEEFSSEAKP